MDEATSFVDPATEEQILRASQEQLRDKSQIIVAHRLSTLKNCHRILWLKNGKAHRIGPSEEVIAEFVASGER